MEYNDYDWKVKKLELDLEQFPALRNLIDVEPEEIDLRCQVIIAKLTQ